MHYGQRKQPERRNFGSPVWSAQEDSELRDARGLGFKWADVAILLGRPSGEACRARYAELQSRDAGPPAAPSRARKCLRCTAEFLSAGAGNRMCDDCRDDASDCSPMEPDHYPVRAISALPLLGMPR